MTETAPAGTPDSALAGAVDRDQVHALLLSRFPDLGDPNDDDYLLYQAAIAGTAVEVEAYSGSDQTLSRWRLAVRTVALGAAADIEAAMLPLETRHPETPLSVSLATRYTRLLGRLAERLPDDPAGPPEAGQPPSAIGDFPDPDPLPYGLLDDGYETFWRPGGWGPWLG